MRYKDVYMDNLKADISPEDKDVVDVCEGYTIFHIGCLAGKLIKQSCAGSSGCEAYPMAKKFCKKRGVDIVEDTEHVADKSYDMVIVDPNYFEEFQDVLISEAARIAKVAIIYGTKHEKSVPEDLGEFGPVIINSKYIYLDIRGLDEHSDSSEE